MSKIKSSDPAIAGLFQYNTAQQVSSEKRVSKEDNGREAVLVNVTREYMDDLKLSSEQELNIQHLTNGSKVVIDGQQAGPFGGPLYTFHRIFSIIILSKELADIHKQQIVPVFWIAGEGHDFDEVNHTFVYNENHGSLHRVKYHTVEIPETTVSRCYPDKARLKQTLKTMFIRVKEAVHTQGLLETCDRVIDQCDSWTDMFKTLLYKTFRAYGALFIDAQFEPLRKMGAPMFKRILKKYQLLDDALRTTQKRTRNRGSKAMIQTDINVHLFLHDENMR